MRDRIATIGPIAAVAGVLGICCGLPVLLSIGMVGAIAGWSLQSWALIGLGLAVAAVGWARWSRSRRSDSTRHHPLPGVHENAAPDQAADNTTPEGTTKGSHL